MSKAKFDSTCNKKTFPDKDTAEAYLWRRRIKPHRTGTEFKVLRSYKCHKCGKYHLTSKQLKK